MTLDLEKFAKMLDMVEKARENNIKKTVQAINIINKNHIELFEKFSSLGVNRKSEGKMGIKDNQGKEFGYDPYLRGDYGEMMGEIDQKMDDIDSSGVTRPEPPEGFEEEKEDPMNEAEDRLLKMTAAVSNRLKAHAEFHKKIHNIILDNHKQSFELFKEMDQYIMENREKRTRVPK